MLVLQVVSLARHDTSVLVDRGGELLGQPDRPEAVALGGNPLCPQAPPIVELGRGAGNQAVLAPVQAALGAHAVVRQMPGFGIPHAAEHMNLQLTHKEDLADGAGHVHQRSRPGEAAPAKVGGETVLLDQRGADANPVLGRLGLSMLDNGFP